MAGVNDFLNSYSKSDGTSDLRERIDIEQPSGRKPHPAHGIKELPDHYKKEDGTIPSYMVIVVSGGEVRERNYLSEIEKKRTFPRIKLIFTSSEKRKGGLSPKMMLSKLEETVECDEPLKSSKILYSSVDRIFMVSDVDHYYSELKEILSGPADSKTTWVVSNPCFEIWLYYAHFAEIVPEVKVLETLPQSKQSSALKTINGEKVPGGIDPRKAFEKLQDAIVNSRQTTR